MANVFVSYNRKSRAIVESLAQDLQELDKTVWFDEDLSGGQTWWNEILGRIRQCDVFVFILDPDSLNSAACKSEYNYAGDLGKPILPILVSDRVSTRLLPPALSQIQFVDYRVQDRKAALQLARAMDSIPPPTPLPDPLPAPPEVPISYLGKLTRLMDSDSDLSFEQQTNLVFQLKQGLNDPGMVQDTCTLLEQLKRRPELLATVAAEIDDLLRRAASSTTDPDPMRSKALDSQQPPKRDSPVSAGPRPGTAFHAPSSNLGGSHPPPGNATRHQPVHNIPNYLVWSILSMIACCPPTGIVSIVYAVQVNNKIASGDIAGAMASSRKAKTWTITSIILGAVCWLLWFLFGVVSGVLQNLPQ